MANETATLAAYVAGLKYEDIPAEVIARARAFLDTHFPLEKRGALMEFLKSNPSVRPG